MLRALRTTLSGLTAAAIGLGTTAGAALASERGTPERADAKTLLMHYMPWYETPEVSGRWGAHWTGWQKQHDPETTDAFGRPDLYSHYHPLMGPYDSADPHAVECQLQQMKLAGVDGVIADWYGIVDHHDYAPIHRATIVLFEQAREVGLTFSVCFEDRTVAELEKAGKSDPENPGAVLAQTFDWVEREWFSADHYQTYMGRPLVLNFGPIHLTDAQPWQNGFASLRTKPAFFALHHLWEAAGADGGFTWVHPNAFKDATTDAEIVANLERTFAYPSSDPRRVITSALPGFHDVYTNPHPYIPHKGGETLDQHLRAAMAADSPIVQLVTWNDYGEGTIIEPTLEFGYRFLEIIQDARRDELGTFAHDHADLRLPAQLFRARKAKAASDATLDRIAQMLNRGDTASARRALERIAN